MVIIIKKIIYILKRLIYSFLLLFSLNVSLKAFGTTIPINELNIAITTVLGIPGLICLFLIKIFIY